ncbi:Hypothetical protein FKW44_020390 [Caligus rogercresseyi]|uniref:Uncharacterized protein n=1 Tax=Caligus rogercresseyi TaxID=217165 RepID=A0A7T8GX81_CALRO|nr:Hypothetical protein FKW44_020390 [Caligus rogercresseyi]
MFNFIYLNTKMIVQVCRFCISIHPPSASMTHWILAWKEEQALANSALSNFLACQIIELIRAALVL